MSILSYNLILTLLFASLTPLLPPNPRCCVTNFFNRPATTSSISTGHIIDVNTAGFPNIVVHATIRNINNEPVPVTDLGNIKILENGEIMPATVQQVEGGVETMIVIDFSSAVSKKRADLIKILTSFIDTMTTGNTTGIILEQPEGVTIIQPLTGDTTVLKKSLKQIPDSNPGMSNGLKGVDSALTELATSLKKGSSIQSVLLISPGIADQRTLPVLIERSQTANVPVHTILLRPDIDEPTQRLQELARETKGISAQYNNADSLTPINNWLTQQKSQIQWIYRSKSATNSERLIEILTTADQKLDQATYIVTLSPAKVIIDFPINNKEYNRQAASANLDIDSVEPTTDQVIAHVEWPDGYPRKLLSAQLFVDGIAEGSPKVNPDDKNITFAINLRLFREPGDNQSQLRVEVKDELGLENKSNPTIINVRVFIPTPLPTLTMSQVPSSVPTLTPEPCIEFSDNALTSRIRYYWCQTGQTVQNYNSYTSIIALLAALLAIFLVILFRRPISRAAITAGDKVREAIVNLTRPTHAEVVGAYLRVLKGDDSLAIKPIPLYINTVTPLGRDMRQAEVVFQAEVERSVISRKHCEIVEESGVYRIRDYGSSHGTFVNGYRLPEGGEGQKLEDGDEIALGPIDRGGVLLMFQMAVSGGLAPSITIASRITQPQAVTPPPPANPPPFITHPANADIGSITKPLYREDYNPAISNRNQNPAYGMDTPSSSSGSLPVLKKETDSKLSDIDNTPTFGMLEPPSFNPPSPVSTSITESIIPDQIPTPESQAKTGKHQASLTSQISHSSAAKTQRIQLNGVQSINEQDKEDPTQKFSTNHKQEGK
jgi:hypothetical protein